MPITRLLVVLLSFMAVLLVTAAAARADQISSNYCWNSGNGGGTLAPDNDVARKEADLEKIYGRSLWNPRWTAAYWYYGGHLVRLMVVWSSTLGTFGPVALECWWEYPPGYIDLGHSAGRVYHDQ